LDLPRPAKLAKWSPINASTGQVRRAYLVC